MMTADTFVLKREGPLATITLSRPERRNSITPGSLTELEVIARSLRDDVECRVVIICAEGRDFTVGADMSVMNSSAQPLRLLEQRRTGDQGSLLLRALEEIPQPTIAAIQGVCVGAGTCIASACDFRFASDSARIGYGEVKLGINLMWHALPRCVRLVGPSRAKRMIMSGALFQSRELHAWGFVDEIVPVAELHASAATFAEGLAVLPPVPVQMIKRSVNAVSAAMDAALMHMDVDQWLLTAKSEDFKEGVTAFLEKRTPRFTGN
jgi:enoyl-CoA hydratase/carnithine racemase